MALRFLARDGSRRLARGPSQPSLPSFHRWSLDSRLKHTICRETFPQTHESLAGSATCLKRFHGKQGLADVNSAGFHGSNLGFRALLHESFSERAGTSFHGAFSNSALGVAPQTYLGVGSLARTGYTVKGSLHAKPSACHVSSRNFCSFNVQALSKHAALPPNHKGLQHTLFKCISTDAIANRLKLSPSIKQPIDGLKKTAAQYKEAAGLRVEAFWKRNVMLLIGAGGILACILLWQIMYKVANIFVSFSEGMAKFGFLAMAASTVAFAALALRARYTINPDKVYRIAMRMLNTSAPALEVLGAPLTGSDLRAYVMSSGGLKLKNFKPRLGSRRCFLMFPIKGADRKGLVSAEVKKKKGKYDFKMLAVDVAIRGGAVDWATPAAEQRLLLVGDKAEYSVGGSLLEQMKEPILRAMAAQEEFDAQDEKEEEEEAKAQKLRILQEAEEEEARKNEEVERLEREAAEASKLQEEQQQQEASMRK